jgi:hypothetical protein
LFQEFAALVREARKNQGESDLRLAFEFYDATGEGQVTATELHRQLSSLGMDISLAECETMIKAASSDLDKRYGGRCVRARALLCNFLSSVLNQRPSVRDVGPAAIVLGHVNLMKQ